MITDDEIAKLAMEYVADVYDGDTDFIDEAENVISWLLRTHCIVSKEKVRKADSKVISGWVCRDNNSLNAQVLIGDKPKRTGYGFWENKSADCITMPKDSFTDLTWEDDPMEVEITIKPKKL